MRVIIVAALIATVALAGCVAPASGLSLQNKAENEATKTYADAVLVGVLGAEWTNESVVSEVTEESPEAAALAEQGVDVQPGDGLANAWAYFFQSEEGGLVVVVAADGSILDTQTLDDDEQGSQTFGFANAIGDVNIDSPEAAAIVNENHGRFTEVAAQEDAMVMMFLVREEQYLDGVYWAFMAFTQEDDDDEGFVFALVDADDGSYRDFSQFFGG